MHLQETRTDRVPVDKGGITGVPRRSGRCFNSRGLHRRDHTLDAVRLERRRGVVVQGGGRVGRGGNVEDRESGLGWSEVGVLTRGVRTV